MVAFLSPEWVERQRQLLAELPAAGAEGEAPGDRGATVRVQYVVTGGPDGDVAYHLAFEGGRVVDGGLGTDADAEVVLTTVHEVAASIAAGDVEPSVAFMQGRLKTEGPTSRLLPLLALTQTEPYRAATDRLRAETD
jgi:putative sterol carrier protein